MFDDNGVPVADNTGSIPKAWVRGRGADYTTYLLPPGEYRVEVTAPGGTEWSRTFSIEASQTTEIVLR